MPKMRTSVETGIVRCDRNWRNLLLVFVRFIITMIMCRAGGCAATSVFIMMQFILVLLITHYMIGLSPFPLSLL